MNDTFEGIVVCFSSTAGSDYMSVSMMITLSQSLTSVSVPILEDLTVESNETFSAVLTSTLPNVVLGENTATITIVDNDGEVLCRYGISHMYVECSA